MTTSVSSAPPSAGPGASRFARLRASFAGARGASQRLPAARHGQRLTLRGLGKRFGERTVLGDVDLDVAPGEFVAVIGRSGCGKSTLLRLIAGLETPTAGHIAADGPPHEVRVMFQDARLLPWRKVLDNVALGLPAGERGRARQVLARVGFDARAGEWPARLSGGQRQRVALARALVHEPSLLLLDEPLGALDALTRIDMQNLIEQPWRRHGFTVLLVMHDVADRVVLIEDGRVTLDERIDLSRPRLRGSAAFAALEARILRRVLAQAPGDGEAAGAEPVCEAGDWSLARSIGSVQWAV